MIWCVNRCVQDAELCLTSELQQRERALEQVRAALTRKDDVIEQLRGELQKQNTTGAYKI